MASETATLCAWQAEQAHSIYCPQKGKAPHSHTPSKAASGPQGCNLGAVLEGLLNLLHARQDGQVDVLLAYIDDNPSNDGRLHLCSTQLVSM